MGLPVLQFQLSTGKSREISTLLSQDAHMCSAATSTAGIADLWNRTLRNVIQTIFIL